MTEPAGDPSFHLLPLLLLSVPCIRASRRPMPAVSLLTAAPTGEYNERRRRGFTTLDRAEASRKGVAGGISNLN
jgi:hypothetical protein